MERSFASLAPQGWRGDRVADRTGMVFGVDELQVNCCERSKGCAGGVW